MRPLEWVMGATALLASSAPAAGAPVKPVKLWETSSLSAPESALPDPTRTFAYVSNVDGKPTEKDGNGFISKVSLKDGKILVREWAKGLDGPKGLALVRGHLFVADIDRLVEIDTGNGKIIKRYEAPGAKFLNDVAADAKGRVYVSDMLGNSIWRLADGTFDVWLASVLLKSPNGLLVDGGNLVVAAWGTIIEGFETTMPGHLLTVSLADKSVKDLGTGTPVGNLDGLQPFGKDSYLVTDWMAGALFRINTSGSADLLLDLDPGSADIGYVPEKQLLLIPMMQDDKLVAYRVE